MNKLEEDAAKVRNQKTTKSQHVGLSTYRRNMPRWRPLSPVEEQIHHEMNHASCGGSDRIDLGGNVTSKEYPSSSKAPSSNKKARRSRTSRRKKKTQSRSRSRSASHSDTDRKRSERKERHDKKMHTRAAVTRSEDTDSDDTEKTPKMKPAKKPESSESDIRYGECDYEGDSDSSSLAIGVTPRDKPDLRSTTRKTARHVTDLDFALGMDSAARKSKRNEKSCVQKKVDYVHLRKLMDADHEDPKKADHARLNELLSEYGEDKTRTDEASSYGTSMGSSTNRCSTRSQTNVQEHVKPAPADIDIQAEKEIYAEIDLSKSKSAYPLSKGGDADGASQLKQEVLQFCGHDDEFVHVPLKSAMPRKSAPSAADSQIKDLALADAHNHLTKSEEQDSVHATKSPPDQRGKKPLLNRLKRNPFAKKQKTTKKT